jgi:hypothetical protein
MMIRRAFLMTLLGLFALGQMALPARAIDNGAAIGAPYWFWEMIKGPKPHWVMTETVNVQVLATSARVGYVAHQVTYVVQNRGTEPYRGGDAFALVHSQADPQPNPWQPQTIARGVLPSLRPGERFRLSVVAYTPRGVEGRHILTLTAGQ